MFEYVVINTHHIDLYSLVIKYNILITKALFDLIEASKISYSVEKELHEQLQFECDQMSNDEDDQDMEGAYAEYEDQLNELG